MTIDAWKVKTAQILDEARKLNQSVATVDKLLQKVDVEFENSKPFRNVCRLEQLMEFSSAPYYFHA